MKRYFTLTTTAVLLTSLAMLLAVACADDSGGGASGADFSADDVQITGLSTQSQRLIDEIEAATDPVAAATISMLNMTFLELFSATVETQLLTYQLEREEIMRISADDFSESTYLDEIASPVFGAEASLNSDEETMLQFSVSGQTVTESQLREMFFMSRGNAIAIIDALIRETEAHKELLDAALTN